MRWIARIDINVGGGEPGSLGGEATHAFLAAFIAAARGVSGVHAAAIASDDVFPPRPGLSPAVEIEVAADTETEAGRIAREDVLPAGVKGGLAALQDGSEVGWSAAVSVDPAS